MENIDWKSLPFGYMTCNCNIRTEYKNGAWSPIEAHTEEYLPIHISAPALHYGVEAFEGLKAFRGVDGKVRLFRPYDNARRLLATADRLCMVAPDEELFVQACVEVTRRNLEFVPPYDSGATLYIRPLLLGTDAVLGISPANEFLFAVLVSPVGAYFKGGMTTIKVAIDTEYDRAAPRGTGAVKCGGNYAASLLAGERNHHQGYSSVVYLDAAEHKYIEECGAANFFGIKGDKYITPKSPSILPSITNMSLRTLAEDMGLTVERRQILVDEIKEFDECGACGTAAVISPISQVDNLLTGEQYKYGVEPGAICTKLYNQLQDIQYGRAEDKYGWCVVVEE